MTDQKLDRYVALALQVDCDGVHPDRDRQSAARRMANSIARIEQAIAGAKRWIGADLKLVVLPEYILSGPPWGESIPEWAAKGAIAPDGPEYAGLAALAQKYGVFWPATVTRPTRTFRVSTSRPAGCSIRRAIVC